MPASTSSNEDVDALFESLENDTENDTSLAHLREVRIQQLSSSLKRSKELRSEGYGSYDQVKHEKALIEITTTTKFCIVHFFKPDFNRCRIMDGHLSALAPAHLETRFLKINVEHAPFLVAKLNVRVLPCVIAFIDGMGIDRIVGFEGLGYSEDTFKTRDLETRLVSAGALEKGEPGIGNVSRGQGRIEERREEDSAGKIDDEYEWD